MAGPFWSVRINGIPVLPDGTAAAPSLAFASDADLGQYRIGADNAGFAAGGVLRWDYNASRILSTLPVLFTTDNTVDIGASGATRPRTGYFGTSVVIGTTGTLSIESDGLKLVASGVGLNVGASVAGTTWNFLATSMQPVSANEQDIGGATNQFRSGYFATSVVVESAANAATWTHGRASELLTLSTGGTTTDTTANLLPANSIIESVVARVTTTITTATSWQLGDATTAGRFTAANSTMTATTTDVGLVHVDVSGAGGPRQTAAAKVRVTTVGTPGAGAIRITVFYRTLVPPTS